AISACGAIIAAYFVLKSNNSLPKMWIAASVGGGIFLLLVGIFIGRRTKSSQLASATPSNLTPTHERRGLETDSLSHSTHNAPSVPVNISVNPTISPTISPSVQQTMKIPNV